MFLVREIKQNLCCEFSEVFFAPPFRAGTERVNLSARVQEILGIAHLKLNTSYTHVKKLLSSISQSLWLYRIGLGNTRMVLIS